MLYKRIIPTNTNLITSVNLSVFLLKNIISGTAIRQCTRADKQQCQNFHKYGLFHFHSFEIKLILQLLVLFLPWLEMTMQSKAMPPSNASFRYQILSNQVSNIIIKYQVSDFQILEKVFFLSFLIPFI